MNFIAKALKAGLSPANIISWFCLECIRISGVWSGTARLRLKAALLGIELGRGVRAHGKVGLLRWPGGRIRIGDRVSLISSWRRATAAALAFPVRLRVFGPGAFIDIGPGCQLSGSSLTARSTRIALGREVLIAPNCIIVDSDFHAPWPAHRRASDPGDQRDSPVTIDDFAWIGMGSIILKGVSIGTGAIVGAGSVVREDVPANAIVLGNPARVINRLPETDNER